MLALAGDVAGRRILDAGCGSGPLSAALRDRGAVVTGIDASAGMLALARRRLGADVARRVLRPGGRLIASVDHPFVAYTIHDPRSSARLLCDHQLYLRLDVQRAVRPDEVLSVISEPQPDPAARELFPDDFEDLSTNLLPVLRRRGTTVGCWLGRLGSAHRIICRSQRPDDVGVQYGIVKDTASASRRSLPGSKSTTARPYRSALALSEPRPHEDLEDPPRLPPQGRRRPPRHARQRPPAEPHPRGTTERVSLRRSRWATHDAIDVRRASRVAWSFPRRWIVERGFN